jgi:hypothetical protein
VIAEFQQRVILSCKLLSGYGETNASDETYHNQQRNNRKQANTNGLKLRY